MNLVVPIYTCWYMFVLFGYVCIVNGYHARVSLLWYVCAGNYTYLPVCQAAVRVLVRGDELFT